MVFGSGGKLKRCKVCYKQKCECGGSSNSSQAKPAAKPARSAPVARSRAESQSALDADIESIATTPKSSKKVQAVRSGAKNTKSRYSDPGADNIPGDPLACNPDREPTDSGYAQNDRIEHGTRGVGTVLGFFGEFVCVQYDREPNGQHKYTWTKARKVLDFSSQAGGVMSAEESSESESEAPARVVMADGRCSECMRQISGDFKRLCECE